MGAPRGDGGSSGGGPQRSELAAKTRQQKAKIKPVGQLEISVNYGRQSRQRFYASVAHAGSKFGTNESKFTKVYTVASGGF